MPQQQTSDAGAFKFTASLADVKMARDGAANWTMSGHAAVFNRLSHDLGGFRAKINPGFFTKILDSNPDVHLNREHNMELLLARTRNKSLELREDPMGLHTWARFAKTPLAEETAVLMEGGFLDQMSFACNVGADQWIEDANGNVTWNLVECDGLFDVCVCAQGAFPQTDSRLVASLRDASEVFKRAQDEGRIVGVPRGDATISVPDLSAALETPEAPAESEAPAVDLAAFKAAALERFQAIEQPEAA